jgi:nitrate/nitrite transporter NarK
MTFGYVLSTIMLPIFGWISDFISKKILIISASLIMIVFSFPVFSLLQTGRPSALFSYMIFVQVVIATMAASYFVLLPSAFQTIIRYTGTAFSYNVAHTIAAMLPLLINYIYGVLKNPHYLLWVLVLLAALTIISTLTFKINNDYMEDKYRS